MTWSPWHDRLHRHLLQRPHLLPQGQTLLLAVSGGQDSMALLGLARDLASRHHWSLQLWHGNHGWHPQSQRCSGELKSWCQQQGLDVLIETADPTTVASEANAREWRYRCLETAATRLQAVVCTAHTATDRSETLLLQLARGTDLRGLCSLREQRPINNNQPAGVQLARPMLLFQRKETLEICQSLQLPIWSDPTNHSGAFARNRIRNEVLPILEALYPGCDRRIADLSERLSQTQNIQDNLVDRCLDANTTSMRHTRELIRISSLELRRVLVHRWMERQGAPALTAKDLDQLCRRLGPQQPPGTTDLPKGWQIKWTKNCLKLNSPQKHSAQEQQ